MNSADFELTSHNKFFLHSIVLLLSLILTYFAFSVIYVKHDIFGHFSLVTVFIAILLLHMVTQPRRELIFINNNHSKEHYIRYTYSNIWNRIWAQIWNKYMYLDKWSPNVSFDMRGGKALHSRLRVRPAKTQISLRIHAVWPRGYKTFFMLNSTEHERRFKNCRYFKIYKQNTFHAQLSRACKKFYNLRAWSKSLPDDLLLRI